MEPGKISLIPSSAPSAGGFRFMSFIPNTTPTPNWLYNGEMKKMTGTQLKVVLLVTRKTLGYVVDEKSKRRKETDWISQKQFMDFTGQSNRAVATAIQSCVKRGWIIARDRDGKLCNTPDKRKRRRVYYQLGNIFIDKLSSEESSLDEKEAKSSELFSKSSEQNDTNLVKKVHNTKEIYTKEKLQNSKTSFADPINKNIYLFQNINPSYKRLFGNDTQRKAMERLLKEHGAAKVKNMIAFAEYCLDKKYAPTITTPHELENNLAKLRAYYLKEKGGNKLNKTLKI